jgi:hypothetical protein
LNEYFFDKEFGLDFDHDFFDILLKILGGFVGGCRAENELSFVLLDIKRKEFELVKKGNCDKDSLLMFEDGALNLSCIDG